MGNVAALFANEVEHFDPDQAEFVGFENELRVDEDGWAQLAPYGDFPGTAIMRINGQTVKRRAIQRVDRQAADAMVQEFKSALGRVKRFFSGRNIYHGHPDVAEIANAYPDKSPKGIFMDLAARDDGFYGKPALTDEGAELVESGKVRAFSAFWNTRLVGEENGQLVFRPDVFKSAGLTNKPNIPVRFFNEVADPNNPQENNMNQKLIKLFAWLTGHGITIANEATDAEFEQALTKVDEKINTASSSAATIANEKTIAQNKVVTLETENSTLKTERDNHHAAFINERKARIDLLLDQAVADGRITPAQKPAWATKLQGAKDETTFANESGELSKLAPNGGMKTKSRTGDLGERTAQIANESERRIKVSELVEEAMAKNGGNYDSAFAKVHRENPQLFEQMRKSSDLGV